MPVLLARKEGWGCGTALIRVAPSDQETNRVARGGGGAFIDKHRMKCRSVGTTRSRSAAGGAGGGRFIQSKAMNEVDAGRQDSAQEEKEEAEEVRILGAKETEGGRAEEKSGCKSSERGESTTQSAGWGPNQGVC